MNDCNRCTCDTSGTLARCTAMACEPRSKRSDQDDLIVTTDQPGNLQNSCEPGTTWIVNCNRCWCSENGMAACTLRGCMKRNRLSIPTAQQASTVEVSEDSIPQGNECVPGTRWKNECNNCWCSETGYAACTLMGCLKKHEHFNIGGRNNNRVKRQVGDKNQQALGASARPESQDKINFPVQVPRGTTLAPSAPPYTPPKPIYNPQGTADRTVTLAELEDPAFRCTPSLSFKLECNTCWCAADGKGPRYCTRIACKPKVYPPLSRQ